MFARVQNTLAVLMEVSTIAYEENSADESKNLQRCPPWLAVRREKSVEVSYSNEGDKQNQRNKRRYASVPDVLTVFFFN